ncbi:MAG: hypothetical protein HC769_05540 [Cyanobacteria bacterium CRU_2_1]|nr:hypothetical protein [Cyanobacteria bacterium RU_5_0]NJR58356.1 hypothetical protein [Cyanobacteria bacterium CRU_2_1]
MNIRWQRYKELELLPDSTSVPKAHWLAFPLAMAWRTLLSALAWEHFYEKRIDYLERCWALDNSELSESNTDHTNTLQKLWMLMD